MEEWICLIVNSFFKKNQEKLGSKSQFSKHSPQQQTREEIDKATL